jgi:hypothetical protein
VTDLRIYEVGAAVARLNFGSQNNAWEQVNEKYTTLFGYRKFDFRNKIIRLTLNHVL